VRNSGRYVRGVQSTHKIPGASATTWSRYLVSRASRGDYYTHDGNDRAAVVQWHGPGRLLRSYGIDPEKAVELTDLRSLMHGFSPVDGEPIRPAGSNGTRVAAIDLTFSPPKDVSALWATSDSYRRAQIEAAHRNAVKSALERTEREVAVVRRKTGGAVRFEKARRLLAVEAVHTSSRLGRDQDTSGIPDPQLHSHVAVIAAERKDGQLAAVESRQLFRAAREGGAWYRAELAANLQDLGLQIERRQGKNERYFAIHGVSKELSEHWSSRSQDVDRAANIFRQRYGREPRPGELDSLTLGTRGSKSAAGAFEVNAAWRALGAEHNQTAARTEELFHDQDARGERTVDLAGELLIEVTRERSMITERELRAKAYELSAGVCRPADADRLVKALARSGELLPLEGGLWTTRRLREMEQRTIEIAQQRITEIAAPVSEQSLKQARREAATEIRGSLTPEQREALETITGPGGVSVLVGRAGTGKGVVISAAARAWQLDGHNVIGIAIAGSRAQGLKDEAKLDRAHTADQLINGIEKGHIKLGPNTVVVMDEAAMSDTERLEKITQLTARANTKTVYVGDAAQIGAIGPGGLFAQLQGKVPTAELTEVHRANHEWEREAWEQIRNGEPGPALAQYQAHDRLHIHDTRAQAAQAMVENWDQMRKTQPDRRAVMLTDASNLERDQMNAMAQERRAAAGELGAHRVQLPGKPYGLAAGDEIIFSAQYPIPGQNRVENGITGTIIDTSRDQDKVTIKTHEREPREVPLDTSTFSGLSLSYAAHVHKAQGITAETSGILIGGWQTDKEHAYVAVSRAREQTQIYVSREDLGEQGFDTGATERLAEKLKRTRAQQASITKQPAEQSTAHEQTTDRPQQQQPATDRTHPHEHKPEQEHKHEVEHEQDLDEPLDPLRGHTHARTDDDNLTPQDQPEQAHQNNDRAQSDAREQPAEQQPETKKVPVNIQDANPADIQLDTRDLGNIQLAYSNGLYDLQAHTGEPTYVLFGGWQTDQELGYVAAVQTGDQTNVHITTEDRDGKDIQTELKDRIAQIIEHSQTNEVTNTSEPDRENQHDLQLGQPALDQQPAIEPLEQDRGLGTVESDSYSAQATQEDTDRQQASEQDVDRERDNGLGFGIE
jgi:conjugative relaxase-like TrwC/TraI family protein